MIPGFSSRGGRYAADWRMSPAVIVGLDCITGLQTARILARRRVPVIGVASDPGHFACTTRACKRILHANTENGDFISALETLGPGLTQRAVLYPCTDMSVLALSRNRDGLAPWYHIVLPRPDVVELLMDKASFLQYAQDHDLPVPRTAFVDTLETARQVSQTLGYPAVAKPRLKSAEWQARGLKKVYRLSAPEDLVVLYERVGTATDTLVVQEWIEGDDSELYSCNCYFSDSGALGTFIARKLRQWPPDAGTSSLGEECRNDVVLHESVRLFESVGYRGLGYVEMKRDARSGNHLVIEANVGRPTGRSSIAEAGDVHLLYAKYCDTLGLPVTVNLRQRYTAVKWIYLRHDVQSALYYLLHRRLSLFGWWRSLRGKKTYAVASWSDPIPFWRDLWDSALKAASKSDRQGADGPRKSRVGASLP